MKKLKELYDAACYAYNDSKPHFDKCRAIVAYSQQKLSKNAEFTPYGEFAGNSKVAYSVFRESESVSRPIRPDLFIGEIAEFAQALEKLLKVAKDPKHDWTGADHTCASQVVYTAIMSFACCFDLWNPGARKTPGTFFEVFMAGLLQSIFPSTDAEFSKHISLTEILAAAKVEPELKAKLAAEETVSAKDDNEADSSVSTDVVVSVPGQKGGVVLPLKITTRERIVQPFAHQRILDAAFGAGVYKSLIVCISETQLAKKTKKVNQICVPGTVKLFQKFLAPVGGLYYCDVPQRYAMEDVTKVVSVKSMGYLFIDLRSLLANQKASES